MFDSATSSTGLPHGAQPPVGTALVVEDHPDFRELLSISLKSLGYDVLEAGDGKEALRLATKSDLNLIVTDLGLPEMDGFDFVRHVRTRDHEERDLKIVMLTAYDRPEFIEKARHVGCDVVLSKPVDLDKLESVINSLQQYDSESHLPGRPAHFPK
jgi:CheY-like chemotaxis protein